MTSNVNFIIGNPYSWPGMFQKDLAMLNERFQKELVYYGQDDEAPDSLNVTRMDSCGSWIASLSDLVRFTLQITGERGGHALLRPETVQAMTRQAFRQFGLLARLEH